MLPDDVVAALQRAVREGLIGNGYQIGLQPDEATALSGWCRAVAPLASPTDAEVFLAAANTIDAAD